MINRSLFVLLSLLFYLSGGLLAKEGKAKSVSQEDAEVLEALGASVGTNFYKFGFDDTEMEFFLKGLRQGLAGEVKEKDIRSMGPRIQAFMRPRMEVAQARERKEEKKLMANLKVPMNLEIQTSAGEKTTLGDLAKGKKGVLLDFWASWCGPCMNLMPELQKKAKKLGSKGILVAGMNTENAGKAESVRKKRKIGFTWLVEPEGRPLSQMLKINSIPRMILVAPDGKVLFNGHPMDDELVSSLADLGVK
ncbi:MAG: redoxin family protein [Opitutae bacterium]|nr:redoxin family protein [Opitutae bacterium]MBT6851314.1 redoxin family protein [Opitutae bacterium]